MTKSNKIIAELVCSPVGEGVSLSKFVKEAVRTIHEFEGIRVTTHPMGTVIEADTVEQVLEVTRQAHEAIFEAGGKRVVTTLKIDDRRDKARVMEDKVSKVRL